MEIKIINKAGIDEIAEFLRANHKKGDKIANSICCLFYWVQEAEFQLSEGNPASIELKSWYSVYNYTQTFTVSSEGIDVITIEE